MRKFFLISLIFFNLLSLNGSATIITFCLKGGDNLDVSIPVSPELINYAGTTAKCHEVKDPKPFTPENDKVRTEIVKLPLGDMLLYFISNDGGTLDYLCCTTNKKRVEAKLADGTQTIVTERAVYTFKINDNKLTDYVGSSPIKPESDTKNWVKMEVDATGMQANIALGNFKSDAIYSGIILSDKGEAKSELSIATATSLADVGLLENGNYLIAVLENGRQIGQSAFIISR